MEFIDTHCHIHDSEFSGKFTKSAEQMLEDALAVGVTSVICVGTSLSSSREAVAFAEKHDGVYASIAIHPHEAERLTEKEFIADMKALFELKSNKIVAVGECGLDYFYHDDEVVRGAQEHLLRQHFELAKTRQLPMIYHIRNAKGTDGMSDTAFSDFMKLYDFYTPKGVVHSFSATTRELEMCMTRELLIGLNGIMTFTTDVNQLEAVKKAPLKNIVIETDAPYLTPKPYRDTINEPKHVTNITLFIAELREESLALVAKQTTKNAKQLFNL